VTLTRALATPSELIAVTPKPEVPAPRSKMSAVVVPPATEATGFHMLAPGARYSMRYVPPDCT
jgi:hypothetical protein